MPSPASRPKIVVDPIVPKNPKMKVQPIKPKPKDGGEKPYPMPRIKDDMVYTQPFPGPGPYSPIKKTKAVNKVYKTY